MLSPSGLAQLRMRNPLFRSGRVPMSKSYILELKVGWAMVYHTHTNTKTERESKNEQKYFPIHHLIVNAAIHTHIDVVYSPPPMQCAIKSTGCNQENPRPPCCAFLTNEYSTRCSILTLTQPDSPCECYAMLVMRINMPPGLK